MTKRTIDTVGGRASLARPSLCFFIAALLLAVAAPTALAVKPPAPALTATNPASTEFAPAFETEPLVFGEGEPGEGHTSSVGRLALRGSGGPLTRVTNHPEYEIKLYSGALPCTGPIVAEGLASTLESSGFQVKVPQDSITTFYALQIDLSDPGNPSDCSRGKTYWEGAVAVPPPGGGTPGGESPGGSPGIAPSTPPAAGGASGRPDAPRLRTMPGGTANDNTPVVTGSAPGATSVKVFADPSCDATPLAKGPVVQFEAGFKIQVADNTAVAFYGLSIGANGAQSRCSEAVYYVEDSTTPHTRITMGPASKTRKRNAIFRFTDTTGNAPGTAFFCKVDRGKWKQCSSPFRLKRLRLKRHSVRVKAVDPAGNAERKAAQRRFKVIPRP